jgi:transposase
MKRGRPTKITEQLTRRVKVLLAKGLDQKTACNLVGVPYSTFNEWKQKGTEGRQPFATFFSVISRARDEHKSRLLKVIIDAAEGLLPRHADWKAAAWLLEKGWPLEFGERKPLPLPEEEQQQRGPSVAFVLSMPGGRKKPVSFSEVEKMYCNFPIIERQEGHEGEDEAKEVRDFQRWQQFGVMPNLPDNMPDNGGNED